MSEIQDTIDNLEMEKIDIIGKLEVLKLQQKFKFGTIYEWRSSNRTILWVLTQIEAVGTQTPKLVGFTLYDKDYNTIKPSHEVNFSPNFKFHNQREMSTDEANDFLMNHR